MTTMRPEFEPIDDHETEATRALVAGPEARLVDWLRLMRLPNVFTALADVAMGFLFVRGTHDPAAGLVAVAAASGCLYTAGMVLNDVFDVEIDRRERPGRPLPTGRIGHSQAQALGWALLAIGVGFAWLAGFVAAGTATAWLSGVIGTLLAGAVVLYNAWLKHTPLGPLGMGLCRFLNVLLGMSLASGSADWIAAFGPAHWLVAGGIGIYIVGVTWFARSEAGESRAGPLAAAMAVMTGGIAMLAASGFYWPLMLDHTMFALLLAMLAVTVLRRCLAAVLDPSSERVQMAVKHSILSLIWFDAALVAATAPLPYAFAIAALLIPALLLGRWVYST
jgi:4-hydroxybenzoate polyprenyltransferase